MAAKLFRPDSAIDPVNDGRHTLTDRPLMRESIPYCVVMPKEKIALFTYTWANTDRVAGAAFGVGGPCVAGEAIPASLLTRPVPRAWKFNAWPLKGFSRRPDLPSKTTRARWQG